MAQTSERARSLGPRSRVGAGLLALALAGLGGCKGGAMTEAPGASDSSFVVVRHPQAAIEFDAPLAWAKEYDESGVTLTSPDDELILMFIAVPTDAIEQALTAVQTELLSMLGEVRMSEFSEGEINGLPAMISDGQGTLEGVPISFGVVLLLSPDGQAVIVVGLSMPDMPVQTGDEFERVLQSIRPTR